MISNDLHLLMQSDLPSVSAQKRLLYRTNQDQVENLYRLLNINIFQNSLIMPEFKVIARCRKYWGYCIANEDPKPNKSVCVIKLSDKWFCKQWLIIILAHEMCHQYQWDIEGLERLNMGKKPIMSHGPSFFKFKHNLAKYNIPLGREAMGAHMWFSKQKYC